MTNNCCRCGKRLSDHKLDRINMLEQECADLEEENKRLEEENKKLKEDVERLIKLSEHKTTTIMGLGKNLDEVKEENKKLREELSAYDREYFDEDKKASEIYKEYQHSMGFSDFGGYDE